MRPQIADIHERAGYAIGAALTHLYPAYVCLLATGISKLIAGFPRRLQL
jgi:hypothetical protein